MMYKIIAKHQPVREIYRAQLIAEGIKEEDIKKIETHCRTLMDEAYIKSKNTTIT